MKKWKFCSCLYEWYTNFVCSFVKHNLKNSKKVAETLHFISHTASSLLWSYNIRIVIFHRLYPFWVHWTQKVVIRRYLHACGYLPISLMRAISFKFCCVKWKFVEYRIHILFVVVRGGGWRAYRHTNITWPCTCSLIHYRLQIRSNAVSDSASSTTYLNKLTDTSLFHL